MSNITKFTISMKRSVAMRRFETAEVFISAEYQIEEGETFKTVVFNAKNQIRIEIEREVTLLKRERQESRDDEMEKAE